MHQAVSCQWAVRTYLGQRLMGGISGWCMIEARLGMRNAKQKHTRHVTGGVQQEVQDPLPPIPNSPLGFSSATESQCDQAGASR